MGLFFGTDGLRGKVNDELSHEIAYKCGNSLGNRYKNSKIIMGRDTRKSCSLVALSFACGAIDAGCDIVDIGVCPTAGVSYLTKSLGFDFGVIISASHNTAEFNGIKIIDKNGIKLGDKREEEIEKNFLKENIETFDKIGTYEYDSRKVFYYEQFLSKSINLSLKGKTIVLDCSNGASYKLAPAVFRDNGAKVIATFCKPDGLNINKDCGSLHIEKLQKYVLKYKADMGFAFDGDSDRVIAVDENGNIVDGDKIIYLFANYYKEKGLLNPNIVVGTRHTNMGMEKALEENGIKLIRTDIGDKYVQAKLTEDNLLIGGEQSGHILLRDKLMTGDGILNALQIASICKEKEKNLSELTNYKPYYQCNINVKVNDKMKVINSEKLNEIIKEEEGNLGENSRIMIRLSGTEPCIRVMVETLNEKLSIEKANYISNIIKEINDLN